MNRLLKGSYIYGISGSIQKLLSFLVLPFLTSIVTPEDFGMYFLIAFYGTSIATVLTLGTGSSLSIIYFSEADNEKRIGVIWDNTMILLVLGSIMMLFIAFFAKNLSVLLFEDASKSKIIILQCISSIGLVLFDPFLAFLRMNEQRYRYVAVTLTSAIFTSLSTLTFVIFLSDKLFALVLGQVVGLLFFSALMFLLVIKSAKVYIPRKHVKELIRVGYPVLGGIFAFLVIDYSDRLFIEKYLGFAELGIYSIGYSCGMVVLILVQSFSISWTPYFNSFIQKHDIATIIFPLVLCMYCYFFGLIVVAYNLFVDPIFSFLFGSEFKEAVEIITIIAATYAMKGFYLILLPGLYFSRRLYLQAIIEVSAAILNIILNFLFIKNFGLQGAAWATFIAYCQMALLAGLLSNRYLKYQYDMSKFAYMAVMLFSLYILSFVPSVYFSNYTTLKFILSISLFCIFGAIIYVQFKRIGSEIRRNEAM